jgi:RsmE family RNA methyltransferase
MNLILLKPSDFVSENTVEFSDFRFEHIKNVLKLKNGDFFKIGLINGKIGSGQISEINENTVKFETNLDKNPPKENPAILFCALPRPKVFRRVLLNAVCFGVKEIHFFQAFKVEKSYWQSPFLQENSVNEIIENGLSQAIDTIIPKIYFHKQFKIFVEDVFCEIAKNRPCFVFHPVGAYSIRPLLATGVVIGPEGGFTDYEISLFIKNNAQTASLGERILRVEQAVCATLAPTEII